VRYDTGWAEYTLVCQHVRKIALATPMLWTIVVHTSTNRGSSKWAELCVERSGSCLLTINVLSPVYHHSSLPTYPLPESCWERACRVAVRGAPPLNHLDLPVLGTALPHLVELDYNLSHASPPRLFLGGHSASLTYLNYCGICLVNAPDLPALRTCILNFNPSPTDELPQIAQLLSGTPLLETLELHLLFMRPLTSSTAATATLPRLNLPCLATVCFDMDAEQLAMITRMIPSPHTALTIYASGNDMPADSVFAYVSTFCSSVQVGGDAYVPSAWIEAGRGNLVSYGIGARNNWKKIESPEPLTFRSAVGSDDRPPALFKIENLTLGRYSSMFDLSRLGETQVSHVVIEALWNSASLLPGLDEWARRQAAAGHALQTARITNVGSFDWGEDTGGLVEMAREWEADGVAKSVVVDTTHSRLQK
jgi:hypothetical protein